MGWNPFKDVVNLGKSLVKGAVSLVSGAVQFVSVLASAIIGKPRIPDMNQNLDDSVGNRIQVPPATNNKVPIVYGSAYVGGTITDLIITTNNQTLYYVLTLCEVTNNETGSSPDNITFGKVYWGGKLCNFSLSDPTKVISLTDESTGVADTAISGNLYMYFYKNGSNAPTNTSSSAITILSDTNITPTARWNSNKTMTHAAFVIIKLNYNADAGTTGIQQTKFQVTNERSDVGDCLFDYLNNSRYGAAIPASQIDTDSLDALSAYSNEIITYQPYTGGTAPMQRFRFDGVLETTRAIQSNMQLMSDCCDCLIRYNEITAKWGVIVQKPTYTVVMDLNDSNIVSAITITPIETASTYNIAEVSFADSTAQDAFNSVTIDLAEVAPSLLGINEPVNKQQISLPLVNNSVRAQYLAARFLKACREDLQVSLTIMFVGLQLEAGDIVSITNEKYGWSAKPFRIRQVKENFATDGTVTVSLSLMEFNATIYDDFSITQFAPASNTGLGNPTTFGTLSAPTITNQQKNASIPSFDVSITASSNGITQYAEVWYSAFANPTESQRIFAGTTAIQSSGTPYEPSSTLPAVTLTNIPSGDWYFFSRMVNSLASSSFSPASAKLTWRPETFQYASRYLMVAYATSITGTGFSFNPRNKTFFGLLNQSDSNQNTEPSAYTWYPASPAFFDVSDPATNYLLYINRGNRKFSFATGVAGYSTSGGAFVPSDTGTYDPTIWSGLPDPVGSLQSYIDLDARTGQLIKVGTPQSTAGEISIVNTQDGLLKGALNQILDFGAGIPQKTSSAATITIDVYGRIIGFETPDDFYYTSQVFTATNGQTAFSVTRGSGYIAYQSLVFQNGVLLDSLIDYTETTSTVTLSIGADAGDIITVISMKSVNSTSGVYASFARYEAVVTNASDVTVSGFTLVSGFEILFLNGVLLTEDDYNITGQNINGFPASLTGKLTIINLSANNLGQPNGSPSASTTPPIIGQTTYNYSFNPLAFNLYESGILLKQGTDYTTSSSSYTLANSPITTTTVLTQQTFARTGAV